MVEFLQGRQSVAFNVNNLIIAQHETFQLGRAQEQVGWQLFDVVPVQFQLRYLGLVKKRPASQPPDPVTVQVNPVDAPQSEESFIRHKLNLVIIGVDKSQLGHPHEGVRRNHSQAIIIKANKPQLRQYLYRHRWYRR